MRLPDDDPGQAEPGGSTTGVLGEEGSVGAGCVATAASWAGGVTGLRFRYRAPPKRMSCTASQPIKAAASRNLAGNRRFLGGCEDRWATVCSVRKEGSPRPLALTRFNPLAHRLAAEAGR
jgi:hypothetical protein